MVHIILKYRYLKKWNFCYCIYFINKRLMDCYCIHSIVVTFKFSIRISIRNYQRQLSNLINLSLSYLIFQQSFFDFNITLFTSYTVDIHKERKKIIFCFFISFSIRFLYKNVSRCTKLYSVWDFKGKHTSDIVVVVEYELSWVMEVDRYATMLVHWPTFHLARMSVFLT